MSGSAGVSPPCEPAVSRRVPTTDNPANGYERGPDRPRPKDERPLSKLGQPEPDRPRPAPVRLDYGRLDA